MANTLKSSFVTGWLLDPFQPTEQHARGPFRPVLNKLLWIVPLMVGIAGLAVALVGLSVDREQFFFSYLVGWTTCLTIALGALFFVLIQHLTKARWSVVVRRIAESLTWSFPLLALLSLPIFFGMHDLYHWAHHDVMDPSSPHFDPVLKGKESYLNVPFFIVRAVIYLGGWTLLSFLLYRTSLRQDVDADPSIPARQRKISAIGLAFTAVSTAFASYDFVMSTDPHWFSTIFGVYFFAASFWTAHAVIALAAVLLQKSNGLNGVVTEEHYHDLGKLMFGFTVFWTYIAFSQYMLIWYGNLPEETLWYRERLEHGWQTHSAILLLFHFVVPFWVLLARTVKRNGTLLAGVAIWFVLMDWFDMHWLIMPTHSPEAGISWITLAAGIGLLGIFFSAFMYRLNRHSLVPQNDPNIAKSIVFAT
ncbi:MAG: hypothetical protein KDD65_02175 [Bacteroidetes bacterium]|nr:hypothetical protein [Bacteroidota bacterium]